MQKAVNILKAAPFLPEQAQTIVNFLDRANAGNGFAGVGHSAMAATKRKPCESVFPPSKRQRCLTTVCGVWSGIRNVGPNTTTSPGTTEEVNKGIKGNYTVLVSDFAMVN
jgi:hypothetical protein